jgi:hypothetical protein
MQIRSLFAAAVLLAAAPSHAQTTFLAPSPMLACLAPMPGAPTTPTYPEELFNLKNGAVVHVALEFSAPDASPKVTIVPHVFDAEFTRAVRDYASKLRLPCMPADAKPVVLKQLYHFTPTDGRKVMPPQTEDPADVKRGEALKCLTTVRPGSRPAYPSRALREEREGKVMVRLHFASADAAPTMKVLADVGGKGFREAVESHAKEMRLPCMTEGPVAIDALFDFHLAHGSKTLLKDMSLKTLVGGIKPPAPISADLNAMGCPFDVRIKYMQPYLPNRVREVETTNPARRPLLEWMRGLQLNFSHEMTNAVFADEFTVMVPCGKIEL